jgi:hypothetical protein
MNMAKMLNRTRLLSFSKIVFKSFLIILAFSIPANAQDKKSTEGQWRSVGRSKLKPFLLFSFACSHTKELYGLQTTLPFQTVSTWPYERVPHRIQTVNSLKRLLIFNFIHEYH